MAKRKQQVSKDKSAKRFRGETDCFCLIPVDVLINNILSKLPLKCMAQCRCVSKQWSSIIRRPNFNQLFLIKSPAPPRLLFALRVGSTFFFYSSPQPQNPDENSSLVATPHHTKNLGTDSTQFCRPIHGLLCSQHNNKKYSWAVISNPITGESVTTPKVSIEGISGWAKEKAAYSFGYDPIDKQFKVLRITWFNHRPDNWYAKYHVLTLGTSLLWRKIQCCSFHYPLDDDNGICINGFLYYPAMIHNKKPTMVCFDVRSEKFMFLNLDQDLARKIGRPRTCLHIPLFLINYKGKLGCHIYSRHSVLWVLEDAEKHLWSKRYHCVPPRLLRECTAGMIGTSNEIVLYPIYMQDHFFIRYYNLDTNIYCHKSKTSSSSF